MENVIAQLLKLAAAVVLAVLAQYLAIRVFDKFTSRIDEMAELKKGNAAVGLVLGAIMVSVAMIVAGGVASMVPDNTEIVKADFWGSMLTGIISLAVSVVLAIAAQFLAIGVFEKMAGDIDVQTELKKRNMGIAVLLSAIIIGMAAIVSAGIPKF
ncbi:MAG: DUF350 domain-containing protein [Candidatus Micrarchaeota archaeon]